MIPNPLTLDSEITIEPSLLTFQQMLHDRNVDLHQIVQPQIQQQHDVLVYDLLDNHGIELDYSIMCIT